MCRHYLGHRLGAFEKCPACGMYGPIGRNGGGAAALPWYWLFSPPFCSYAAADLILRILEQVEVRGIPPWRQRQKRREGGAPGLSCQAGHAKRQTLRGDCVVGRES